MQDEKKTFNTIDEYIASFPPETQKLLEQVRAAIRKAAPDAAEKISYQMPTFFLDGNLVHFAAYKNHIGFYPTPNGVAEFELELSVYQRAKGSVQFPINQPLPLDLIGRITKYRAAENAKKTKAKSAKKA